MNPTPTQQQALDAVARAREFGGIGLDASLGILCDFIAAHPEQPQAVHAFCEIMAVIHGDGGHYLDRHGVAQSLADAIVKYHALTAERDQWRNSAQIEANERKSWQSRAERAEVALAEENAKYNELVLSVGNTYADESRHETALRYIRRAEQPGPWKIEYTEDAARQQEKGDE